MNKKYKNLYLILVLIGVGFLAALTISKLTNRPESSDGNTNPFEYNVDKYKYVPPKLINYTEQPAIKLPFKTLNGLAVGPDNTIYVTGDKNLLILNHNGQKITDFSLSGTPGNLSVSNKGDIYIAFGNRIEIYNKTGKSKAKWNSFPDETIITSIAISGKNVFVADAGCKIVRKLDLEGQETGKIGAKNPKEGIPGFVVPSPYFDLLIDSEGHLLVVNPGCHKLEQFTEDGSLISIWGNASIDIEGFCGCCNPTYIAELSDRSIVTSEKGLPRVKVYDATGTFLSVVAGPDSFAEETVGLVLAVDSNDRILVLDPKAGTVRIFVKKNAELKI